MSLVSRCLAVAAIGLASLAAQSQTLRVGLAEDPDVLDPTLARTFVGRIVFASLCDKLFDVDEKLQIVPQLATGYEWSADSKTLTIKLRNDVTFHDGEKLDAAAAMLATSLSAGLASGPAAAQSTLRIGLAEDPDVLDPTLARTYVGRIVFSSICDKLFDIDEKLGVVPQLATG